METDSFEEERDTSRAIFYWEDDIDPKTGELVKIEMAKIQSPGEALNVYGGRVRDEDRQRFSKAYEAFKKGEEAVDGIPLALWPEVAANVDFMSQLRGFGFHTVEDMSKMADSAQRLFHGSLTWKKKAERFLAEQAKLQSVNEYDARESEKDKELAELRGRLSRLEMASAPKPRGRPRKESTL